jgi:hypothetical protein
VAHGAPWSAPGATRRLRAARPLPPASPALADISELNLAKTTSIHFPDGKDKLLNFEKTAADPATAAAPGQPGAPPAEQRPPSPPLHVPIAEDFGYGLAVAIAAENLQYAQAQLRNARLNPDDTGRIKQCEGSVNAALSEYRKAKNDEHDLLSKQGDMVPRRLMLQKFGVRLASLHQGVRSIPLRAGSKLALPPDVIRALVASMNDELDALFTQLKQDAWQFKERLTLS